MRYLPILLSVIAIQAPAKSATSTFLPEPWAGESFAERVTTMNAWLEECRSIRADLSDARSGPSRVQATPQGPADDRRSLRTLQWSKVSLPLPEMQFDSVVLIPGGIASVRGPTGSVLFSSIDLTAHFKRLSELEEFSEHASTSRNLIDWLDRGLKLGREDLQCVRNSKSDDVINVVHQLSAKVLVMAGEDTKLMRIPGRQGALILGEISQRSEIIHIQYFVQSPRKDRTELIHVSYHLDWQVDPVQAMNEFAASLSGSEQPSDSNIAQIVRAILDKRYEEAAALGEAGGVSVQVGLH